MAARPTVTVQSTEAEGAAGSTVAMPAVLLAPIRPDVVHDVHKDMAKNNRQAYSVSWMAGAEGAPTAPPTHHHSLLVELGGTSSGIANLSFSTVTRFTGKCIYPCRSTRADLPVAGSTGTIDMYVFSAVNEAFPPT